VITRQEVDLFINPLDSIEKIADHNMKVVYTATPKGEFNRNLEELIPPGKKRDGQLKLFK
jgi:hypothetical protein